MMDRRRFMEACTGLGLGSTLFPGVLWAQAQGKSAVKITKEMIDAAAAIADVAISEEYKQMMLDNLNEQAKGYEAIYALHIPNSVEPALLFYPVVNAAKYETERKAARLSATPPPVNRCRGLSSPTGPRPPSPTIKAVTASMAFPKARGSG